MPLHTVRFMKRGYNQSALIGRALARELDLPYRSLLKRTRRTRQQAKLGRDARLTNLQNAFHAQPLRGEAVLLVDDVYTTGATVTECALELLCKGAGRVYIATVARA